MMLQYIFDDDLESIEIKPHGQAKKNQHPFFTTASGTRTKISEKVTSLLTLNLMRTFMQDCCILKRFGEVRHKGITFTPIFLSTSQKTWKTEWSSQFEKQLVWGTISITIMGQKVSIHLWRARLRSQRKPSKCSYGEFVKIVSAFVSWYRHNVHWAVVGDGPYKLAPNYQHLAVTEDSWTSLLKKERVAKISALDLVGAKKLHQVEMEGSSIVLSVPGPSQKEASVSTGDHSSFTNFPVFDCSGLPEYLRGSWDNAQDIISRSGATKISESTMMIVSLTNPHIVNHAGSKVTCDCKRLKVKPSVAMSLLSPTRKIIFLICHIMGAKAVKPCYFLNPEENRKKTRPSAISS